MVELAVAGKRYRAVSKPDKVATAVFRLLGVLFSPVRYGSRTQRRKGQGASW